METIIVKIDTAKRADALLKYFKTLIGVKSAARAKHTPLTSEDWVRPGRPATDEELEQLAVEMENDGPGEESEIVFRRIKRGLKK